jgi:hypothetical protein
MSKLPAFQFYPGDWLKDPQLSICSPATRGIWIDLLCAMHELRKGGEITGSADQFARLCRCMPSDIVDALAELKDSGAADVEVVTDYKNLQSVRVVSRRMKRDAIERERWRYSKERSRVPALSHKSPGVSSSSPSKSAGAAVEIEDQNYPSEWVSQAEAEAAKAGAGNPGAYIAKVLESWKRIGGPPRNAKAGGGGPAIPKASERSPEDFCENCGGFVGRGSREITVNAKTGEKKLPTCKTCKKEIACL